MVDPTPQTEPEDEVVIDDLDTLKVYFDPLRTRIVRTMVHKPRSVHEIAEELGLPFTRLYYHINMLEKHGIIRLVEVRNIGGAVEEKYYQVRARSFIVDRRWLTMGDPGGEDSPVESLMSTLIDGTKEDIRRSVKGGKIDLTKTSPHPDALMIRRGISRMSREQAHHFHERLLQLLQEFAGAEAEGEAPLYYAFSFSFYPTELAYSLESDETNGSTVTEV